MGFYWISCSPSGKFNALHVNASAPSQFSQGLNVDLSSKKLFNIPVNIWYIGTLGNNVQIQCAANMRYRLGMNTSTRNCDVRLKNYAAYVNIKAVSGEQNRYRIQLVSNSNLYLTVDNASGAGENVYWAELDSSNAGQKWTISEATCEYAYANDWLRMRTTPSATGGEPVAIPREVRSYHETTDGVTQYYDFTDANSWYACEDPYDTKINPNAVNEIKSATGKEPVINSHPCGAYTDENSRYWIAVGPKVVYPGQRDDEAPDPENMYAKGFLDVVIKDEFGTMFYIPAVVGDIKAHTWSNGIIQTYKIFPNGTYTPMEHKEGVTVTHYNGQVCAEFIGAHQDEYHADMANLFTFSIDCIIFYESK